MDFSDERRKDYQPNGRLSQIEDILREQAAVTSRLVIIAETQGKRIEDHEKWIDSHTDKYHSLHTEVSSMKLIVAQWSDKISDLNTTLKTLVDLVAKFKGGWFVLGIFGGLLLGAVSLLKSFGVI